MDTGIGVDMVEIDRMERIIDRTPSFARRVFTEEERAYCERMARPAVHYAARFAAREAVLKALGTGFSQGIRVQDVSVSRDEQGRPRVLLSGRAAEIARAQGVEEIALSLSHTNELAVANALALTASSRPRPKKAKQDERAQIAQSFREARAVLDELERVQAGEMLEVSGLKLQDESDDAAPDAVGSGPFPSEGSSQAVTAAEV